MKKFVNKVLLLFSGTFVLYATAWLFDYILYPFVIYRAGLLYGFFIMIILSFINCLLFLLVYNYLKKDIFSFEYSKKKISDFVDTTNGNWLKRTFRSILKHSKIILFIFLSVYDPFIATVFMQKGNNGYNRMTAYDWNILILSVIIGNGIWAPTVFAGISFTEYIYKLFVVTI